MIKIFIPNQNVCNSFKRGISLSRGSFEKDNKWKKLIDLNWLKAEYKRSKIKNLKEKAHPDPWQCLKSSKSEDAEDKGNNNPCSPASSKVVNRECYPCVPRPRPVENHPVLSPIPEIPLPDCDSLKSPVPDSHRTSPELVFCPEKPRPLGPAIDNPTRAGLAEYGYCAPLNIGSDPKEFVLSPRELCEKRRRNYQMLEIKMMEDLPALNAAPADYKQTSRIAFIYMPPKNVMQQGTCGTKKWCLSFNTMPRWENPLMGWTSSGDSFSNLLLEFPTERAAIKYCKNNGYAFQLFNVPKQSLMINKSYGDLFSHNRRTRGSTK